VINSSFALVVPYLNSLFEIKKRKRLFLRVYFSVLGLGFGFYFDFGFASAFTSFIGSPQHITSHGSHSHPPQGVSTAITSPHSSHLYFSPFLFAKN